MPSPTEAVFKEIASDFSTRWNFPNCIESIGAKHIRIHCPPNSGSQYFNYKQCHSIVLQAVVDVGDHASAKQTLDLFCNFFNSTACSVLWQEEAVGHVQ